MMYPAFFYASKLVEKSSETFSHGVFGLVLSFIILYTLLEKQSLFDCKCHLWYGPSSLRKPRATLNYHFGHSNPKSCNLYLTLSSLDLRHTNYYSYFLSYILQLDVRGWYVYLIYC